MICIRCRKESKGDVCLHCRGTGSRKAPPAIANVAAAAPPAKSSKGTLIAVVLIVVTVLVAGGIKLSQKSNPTEKTEAAAPTKVASTPKATPTSIPTAVPAVVDQQKKIGELLKEMLVLQHRMDTGPAEPELRAQAKDLGNKIDALALAACGNDKSKVEPYIVECMAKYAPEFLTKMGEAKVQATEALAASTLRSIWQLNSIFYTADSDGNGVKDFWVLDISGLQRLVNPKTKKQIALFTDASVPLADGNPAVPLNAAGKVPIGGGITLEFAKLGTAAPCHEYLFQAVMAYRNEKGEAVTYNKGGNGRNPQRSAICAYPATYGKCKTTFLISDDGAVHSKDTGGAAVLELPKDLAKDGWK